MDREKQFEKTIEDIENIKCLALYLLEAVSYGEDPDAEREVNATFIRTVSSQIREFTDSILVDYLEESGQAEEM